MTHVYDTITALATPPGRGGIAVIRISGPTVQQVMTTMLGTVLTPRKAHYLSFLGPQNEKLDEGIALFFPAPHSFTGEDVLELHGHGGPVVVDMLLQRILSLGPRLAKPGEFSERAFLNGKLDLTQAEAIADLIDASSQQAARLAMRSLQGEFSKAIYAVTDSITQIRILIEAAIDFSDEDIELADAEKIHIKLQDILNQLKTIQQQAQQGHVFSEGITAVIAGKPNVGKSSLLNCLSAKEVAIVTDIPGTTRDILRNLVLIDGVPVHIVDTAGLRESEDEVEQEGIRRAVQELKKADIVLCVLEAGNALDFDANIFGQAVSIKKPIYIRNKIDLTNELPSIKEEQGHTVISLSVKKGLGLDLLKGHIKAQAGLQTSGEGLFLARRRHLEALRRAELHLENSIIQWQTTRANELIAEELRLAQQALGEMTGEFTADDLLGRIFSSFCIGK